MFQKVLKLLIPFRKNSLKNKEEFDVWGWLLCHKIPSFSGDFSTGILKSQLFNMSGMGLSLSELCCLFCCPPFPSRIAAKLAFLPPEPTYAMEDEDTSGAKQKLVRIDPRAGGSEFIFKPGTVWQKIEELEKIFAQMAQWSLPYHYFQRSLVRYPKLRKEKKNSTAINVKIYPSRSLSHKRSEQRVAIDCAI